MQKNEEIFPPNTNDWFDKNKFLYIKNGHHLTIIRQFLQFSEVSFPISMREGAKRK